MSCGGLRLAISPVWVDVTELWWAVWTWDVVSCGCVWSCVGMDVRDMGCGGLCVVMRRYGCTWHEMWWTVCGHASVWMDNNWTWHEMRWVSCSASVWADVTWEAVDSGPVDVDVSKLPLSPSEAGEETMRFYWLDASEDFYKQPGRSFSCHYHETCR